MKKIINKIKNYITTRDFYKVYKEELVFIPIILIIFYTINTIFTMLFPNSAFFDFFSQLETILYKLVNVFIAFFIAHFALNISFPAVYKYLHTNIYHSFSNLPENDKVKYSIAFILIFILATSLIF